MGKFHALFLIQIAFATVIHISSCDGSSDHVAVVRKSAKMDCRGPKTVHVTFRDLKFKINDVDVVYERFEMALGQRTFAYNISEKSIVLPCKNPSECAKVASREGYNAFQKAPGVNDWYGYNLYQRFLKCGDLESTYTDIVYLRQDMFVQQPTVVPFAEAPYMDLGRGLFYSREYRLSNYIETNPENKPLGVVYDVETLGRRNHIIGFSETSTYLAPMFALDMNYCLNDGAYGMRIVVARQLYNATLTVAYFFDECGNTVKIPATSAKDFPLLVVYSHRGFGCSYYPVNLPDECTVTFESEDSSLTNFWFSFPYSGAEDRCTGLDMTITASPNEANEETKDACDPNGFLELNGTSSYSISLRSHPSNHEVGFYAKFMST